MNREAIQEKIQERQKSFPVDVVALANDLGIDVYESGKFADSESGVIGSKDGKTFIIVNKNHPATRQMFTIAHEIGHYARHGKALADTPVTGHIQFLERNNGPHTAQERKMEIEANEMAADILMPETEFKRVWQDNKMKENVLSIVARYFGVSEAAANVRASKILGEYAI